MHQPVCRAVALRRRRVSSRRSPDLLRKILAMRILHIGFMLGFFLALTAAASPARAQDVPVHADTVRGPVFSDRVIAQAFGLRDPDDSVEQILRKGLRCGRDDDAVLCNLEMPRRTRDDCANAAVMGQFIVVFGMLNAQPLGKQVYVAVDCGDEPQVTVSSRWKEGAVDFTLRTDVGSKPLEHREVVYVRTATD